MLTDQTAKQLAETLVGKLKNLEDSDPKASWALIFSELFKSIRENGVVEVKELESIVVQGATLASSTGPVAGAISPPSTVSLKGKIT